jgi:hypothetical protein
MSARVGRCTPSDCHPARRARIGEDSTNLFHTILPTLARCPHGDGRLVPGLPALENLPTLTERLGHPGALWAREEGAMTNEAASAPTWQHGGWLIWSAREG